MNFLWISHPLIPTLQPRNHSLPLDLLAVFKLAMFTTIRAVSYFMSGMSENQTFPFTNCWLNKKKCRIMTHKRIVFVIKCFWHACNHRRPKQILELVRRVIYCTSQYKLGMCKHEHVLLHILPVTGLIWTLPLFLLK